MYCPGTLALLFIVPDWHSFHSRYSVLVCSERPSPPSDDALVAVQRLRCRVRDSMVSIVSFYSRPRACRRAHVAGLERSKQPTRFMVGGLERYGSADSPRDGHSQTPLLPHRARPVPRPAPAASPARNVVEPQRPPGPRPAPRETGALPRGGHPSAQATGRPPISPSTQPPKPPSFGERATRRAPLDAFAAASVGDRAEERTTRGPGGLNTRGRPAPVGFLARGSRDSHFPASASPGPKRRRRK